MFKSNQTRHGASTVYLESNTKRIFVVACLEKVRISIGNIDLFAYSIFKNREILSGQGVVQMEPNSVWSILRLFRS